MSTSRIQKNALVASGCVSTVLSPARNTCVAAVNSFTWKLILTFNFLPIHLSQVEGGADHSPQLSWDAGPDGTKSYVENWKQLLLPFKTLVDALTPLPHTRTYGRMKDRSNPFISVPLGLTLLLFPTLTCAQYVFWGFKGTLCRATTLMHRQCLASGTG